VWADVHPNPGVPWTNWNAGEPNGGPDSDCVSVWTGGAVWDDLNCHNGNAFSFSCEMNF